MLCALPDAPQELGQVAGEVNILGVIAVALFILIPGARNTTPKHQNFLGPPCA